MELNLYGSKITPRQRKALNYFASRLFSPQMIPNLHIRVKYKRNMGDMFGCVYIDDYNEKGNPRYFVMEIAKEDAMDVKLHTMAHEMIHVRQFVRGDLDEDMTRWKSRRVNADNIPYRELPWEIEANRLGEKLYLEFLNGT